jgi:2-hydroxychromene-2-carboxylate isomerase
MGALAPSLGLPAALLADAHCAADLRVLGLVALRECIDVHAFGVPFFVTGRERYWGLDRLPDFIGALADAGPSADALVPGPALMGRRANAIFDHAGGCG